MGMARLTEQQRAVLKRCGCELATDTLTRVLYSTDASIYREEPAAIAFPRTAAEVSAAVQAAGEAGLSVTARGAGSGVAGGAIGPGLVVDFSRYMRRLGPYDPERQAVFVEAGVVLDSLNQYLRQFGMVFGPEVATSSRATIGGMIGNDSSGARTLLYGTTADHVLGVEVVLADGRTVWVSTDGAEDSELGERIRALVFASAAEIQRAFPMRLAKRWPGYGLDRYVRSGGNLNYLICGSEGTLGLVTRALLRVVPLPRQVGMAVLFFSTLAEALECAPRLVGLKPAAVEVVDRLLFDQTRGQLQFARARRLLGLDEFDGECFLIVEVYEDVNDKLAEVLNAASGQRAVCFQDRREIDLVWALRKAGLSLLTARKGPRKPVAGVEDTVVPVDALARYAADVRALLNEFDVEASFYGHAEAGLLHIRPMLDLRSVSDVARFRAIADAVSGLVRKYNGSIAGEHGCGMARTEYLPQQLALELMSLLAQVKAIFDPRGLLNPGKIVDTGRYRIDSDLRYGPGYTLQLPFTPQLRFARRDESFLANLDQCNGCAFCRKQTPTMCPTFAATGREEMCTRGRANVIRAALERRFGQNPLDAPELWSVLESCLSCKACPSECPSNVNLPMLKAELVHARHQRNGVPAHAWLFGYLDVVLRLGAVAPAMTNAVLGLAPARWVLWKVFGVTRRRPMPRLAPNRFWRWYNPQVHGAGHPRTVILWDDTYVRYLEPELGIAAVQVLNALGFNVILPTGHRCCGRPAFSQGLIRRARALAEHNIAVLSRYPVDWPVVFLEPSCWSMFVDDYIELGVPGAEDVAGRCHMFDRFVAEVLASGLPAGVRIAARSELVAVHAHCHAKSLADQAYVRELVERLPGRQCKLLATGCCGMAGAFGMMDKNYELSVRIAEPLVRAITELPAGAVLVFNGTSCRQQVEHLTGRRPLHMARFLAKTMELDYAQTALH